MLEAREDPEVEAKMQQLLVLQREGKSRERNRTDRRDRTDRKGRTGRKELKGRTNRMEGREMQPKRQGEPGEKEGQKGGASVWTEVFRLRRYM